MTESEPPDDFGSADTVVDETQRDTPDMTPEEGERHSAIPATEDDPSIRAVPAKGKSKKWLWGVLAGLVAVLGGVGAYIYFVVWKYEPTALRHLPEGANIVVRADAAKIATFKPVREHLWPLLLEGKGDDKERRLQRIKEETGVSIPADLRELVVASSDGVAWVALFGGNIEPGRFVDGVHTVLQEEELAGWSKNGEWLVHERGSVIGQAADGTLILATHQAIADASLPASEPDEHGPVPTEEAIGFHITHAAFKRIVKSLPAAIPSGPLGHIDDLKGTITLSNDPTVALDISPRAPKKADALASDISTMFSQLGLAFLLLPGDLYGAKSAINKADVSASADQVKISAPWPYAPLDNAIAQMAKGMSGTKDQ